MRPAIRTRRGLAAALALFALALTAGAAIADVRFIPVDPWADLGQAVQAACATPGSPACAHSRSYLTTRALAALKVLIDRRDDQAAAMGRLAADAADSRLRAAAAEALAVPFAANEDTPLLAELADDPVPAVRDAARRALASSGDPRAQRLARRIRSGSLTGEPDETPEKPPAAAAMGVPLPADAVYLFFASEPANGRYAWWTAKSPAEVAAALRGKAKKGPLTPAEFRAHAEAASEIPEIEDGELPSAEAMARAFEMAEQMMAALEGAGADGGSPEAMAAAMQRAAGGLASLDPNAADEYEDADLYADARLFVVPVAGSSDALVAVYRDLATGGTGLTIQRTAVGGR